MTEARPLDAVLRAETQLEGERLRGPILTRQDHEQKVRLYELELTQAWRRWADVTFPPDYPHGECSLRERVLNRIRHRLNLEPLM